MSHIATTVTKGASYITARFPFYGRKLVDWFGRIGGRAYNIRCPLFRGYEKVRNIGCSLQCKILLRQQSVHKRLLGETKNELIPYSILQSFTELAVVRDV